MSLPASLFSNLTQMPARSAAKSAVERHRAAQSAAEREARLKRKVEQAQRVLVALEARAAACAAEIKRLQALKKSADLRAERIEDAALTLMQDAGLEKITGLRTTFTARLAPAALEVVNASLVPAEFLRQPPPEVNKTLLKAALAANAEMNPAKYGCKLTQKVTLMRK
jgi:hypothetical protein